MCQNSKSLFVSIEMSSKKKKEKRTIYMKYFFLGIVRIYSIVFMVSLNL